LFAIGLPLPMSHSEAVQLISIRKTSEEPDRLDEMMKAATASYAHAVKSAAQYTVELDPSEANLFREHLDRIRADAERAAYPADWQAVQSSFRGELRDHRDRSLARLAKLRDEMKAAADVMQTFADNVAESGADHHENLHEALHKLAASANAAGLEQLRAAVAQTSAEIGASIERMERAHTLVIAQLRDEIRLLHHKIDAERQAVFLDTATGVWNRRKLEAYLKEILEAEDSFCALVVCIRNLNRLDQRYSPAIVESGVKALLQRFSTMVGEQAVLGRWDEETFAAILPVEPAAATPLSREAAKRLSGAYSVQENGMSRSIELQAAAGVIERSPDADATSFREKLLQLSAALLNL
jgi:GGDEF domain-containing protein